MGIASGEKIPPSKFRGEKITGKIASGLPVRYNDYRRKNIENFLSFTYRAKDRCEFFS